MSSEKSIALDVLKERRAGEVRFRRAIRRALAKRDAEWSKARGCSEPQLEDLAATYECRGYARGLEDAALLMEAWETREKVIMTADCERILRRHEAIRALQRTPAEQEKDIDKG